MKKRFFISDALFEWLADIIDTGHKQTVNWPYIYTMISLLNQSFLAMVVFIVFFPLNLLFKEKRARDCKELIDGAHIIVGRKAHKYDEIKLSKPTEFVLKLWLKVATYFDAKWNDGNAVIRAQLSSSFGDSRVSKWAAVATLTPVASESDMIEAAMRRGVKGVLSDRNSLSVFMQHLMSEFSAENLLALIEFVQFNGRFQGQGPSEKWIAVLRDEVAKSDIVFGNDVYRAIHGLYARYVANGAEYEINVNYLCREPIIQLVESDEFANGSADERKLHKVFDEALAEVLGVMRDSYFRWERTVHFKRYALSVTEPMEASL